MRFNVYITIFIAFWCFTTPVLCSDSVLTTGDTLVFAALEGREQENLSQFSKISQKENPDATHVIVLSPPQISSVDDVKNYVAKSIPGKITEQYSELARINNAWLAVPIFEESEEQNKYYKKKYYQTMVLISPNGEVRGTQRRRNTGVNTLATPTGNSPELEFVAGSPWDAPDSIDIDGYRLGMLHGEDLRIGVPRLAGRGAETILVAANWLESSSEINWNEVVTKLAQEHSVNIVVANTAPGKNALFTKTSSREQTKNNRFVSFSTTLDGQSIRTPLGLPSLPLPVNYQFDDRLSALGRDMFFDRGLSRTKDLSCQNCHDPLMDYANREVSGIGIDGKSGSRNVPSLLNVAYRNLLHWDGSSAALELQAKFPMSHVNEMDSHYLELVDHVRNEPGYVRRFEELGYESPLQFEDISKALASYQRTLISGNSAFDKFQYAGDEQAMTASAQRGMGLFQGKANCSDCHTMGKSWSLFADSQFHNTGVAFNGKGYTDLGWGSVSYGQHSGMFLTPTLRNIGLTAPYMHDGSIATLSDVVDFYNDGGKANPLLDEKIVPLGLSNQEKQDLVAFLESLNGDHRFTPSGEPIYTHESQRDFKVAAVKFSAVPGDKKRNREELRKLVREAADNGASIIVLPEYAETGRYSDLPKAEQSQQQADYFKSAGNEAIEQYKKWAVSLNVWIAATVIDDENFVSSLLIDDRGNIRAKHDKVNLRSHGRDINAVAGEPEYNQNIVTTPYGRIGIVSGDDVALGIDFLQQLDAEIILVMASWEDSDGVDWPAVVQHRAEDSDMQVVISDLSAPLISSAQQQSKDVITYLDVQLEQQIAKLDVPLGLPEVPGSADMTDSCNQLGEELFFETKYSEDGETSCATCHDPQIAFVDRVPLAVGAYGRVGQRNTPTVFNVAYRPVLFWDGRAATLEDQIHHAVVGWAELSSDAHQLLMTLEANKEKEFDEHRIKAEGLENKDYAELVTCIADYERTLLSGNSAFDRYYFTGDREAISEEAQLGFEIFKNKGACAQCHQITPERALFSDNGFHNTGVGFHERFLYLGYGGDGLANSFAGRDQFLGEYVTPSLRDIALTPPYMHDGSISTLEEVVDFYNDGGSPKNPFQDEKIRPLGLTDVEKKQLVAFLNTLNGDHSSESSDHNVASNVKGRE